MANKYLHIIIIKSKNHDFGRPSHHSRRRSTTKDRRYCYNNIIVVPWSNEKTRKLNSPRLPLNGSIVINFVISQRWVAKEKKYRNNKSGIGRGHENNNNINVFIFYIVFVFIPTLLFLIERWLGGDSTAQIICVFFVSSIDARPVVIILYYTRVTIRVRHS